MIRDLPIADTHHINSLKMDLPAGWLTQSDFISSPKSMVPTSYLTEFKKAAGRLDGDLLTQKKLNLEVGVWLESVVLRLQKSAWANKPFQQPQSDAGIFFSIWLNDKAVKENKILYNIHALKLRQLKGYKIASREFAAAFRAKFRRFEQHWPNIRVDFGPLTLMQGWERLEPANLQEDIFKLAGCFLEMDTLIDDLLDHYIK
jgi:hypothetical protein